jgi:type IV pilus assembly protein PilA
MVGFFFLTLAGVLHAGRTPKNGFSTPLFDARNATMNTPRAFTRSQISKGFTLIELMIGIAIIGVLSAIAIPAFQDYLNRSKVTELLNIAQSCKAGVIEFAASTNVWPSSSADAGCQSAVAANSKYSETLTLGAQGKILVSFKNNQVASGLGTGQFIALVPWSGAGRHTSAVAPIGQWRCVTNVTGDLLRYIPAACRNADVT